MKGDHKLIEILKALSDETRLRILSQILKNEMCVCEIEECLELTQSNASRHLTVLKKAGILESYKNAQWSYYRISNVFIKENKELYDYIIKKVRLLPGYESDCRNFENCRMQEICKNKI